MASSVALQSSRYGHSGSSGKRHGKFAETSPRTVVGLQKVNVQLQKEVEKLEKQAQTAVTNIANHQQAMKMSWRRLEESRNMEKPILSHLPNNTPKQPRTVLSSRTRLYVSATPDIYNADSHTLVPREEPNTSDDTESNEMPRTSSTSHLHPQSPAKPRRFHSPQYLRNSPYITSPYNIRKMPPKRRALTPLVLSTLVRTEMPDSEGGKRVDGDGGGRDSVGGGKKDRSASASGLKLPPINSPTSQPSLVTNTTTVDKDTLLRASRLMGLDSSQGPSWFREFYANDRPPSQAIRLSSVPPAASSKGGKEKKEGDGNEAGKSDAAEEKAVEESSSEPTLDELFEQIRHCRYIRHYNPDGTKVEEYY